MRPGDLSAAVEAAAQPGSDPGPGQAEHATEYSDDPLAEYTPAYSSGSFTEFIAATSEADIPPFSAEPLPDAVAPGAYGPPAPGPPVPGASDLYAHGEPDTPVNAVPDILGYDEPAAVGDGAPDTQESAPDAQEYDQSEAARGAAPDIQEYGEPAGPDDRAPGAWGQDEPAAPSGGAAGRLRPRWAEFSGPGQARLLWSWRAADSGNDLSGDAADTPVSGFHAMIRLPAAPAAERPSPPRARPSPPSAPIPARRARRVVAPPRLDHAACGGANLPARRVAHPAPSGCVRRDRIRLDGSCWHRGQSQRW